MYSVKIAKIPNPNPGMCFKWRALRFLAELPVYKCQKCIKKKNLIYQMNLTWSSLPRNHIQVGFCISQLKSSIESFFFMVSFLLFVCCSAMGAEAWTCHYQAVSTSILRVVCYTSWPVFFSSLNLFMQSFRLVLRLQRENSWLYNFTWPFGFGKWVHSFLESFSI